MNLGDLIRQAQEGDFIEGIYNYCDRWCERCPQTSKCLLYYQERNGARSAEELDPENQAFWESLAQSLKNAAAILTNAAAEQGADLSKVAESESAEIDLQQRLEQEPLPKLAHQYAENVDHWFQSASGDFDLKGEELRSIDAMEIEGADPAAEADDIADCVEIIRWYQYQIAVKLMRAYSSVTKAMHQSMASEDDLSGLRDMLAQKAACAAEFDDFEKQFGDVDDSEWSDESDADADDELLNAEADEVDDPFAELDEEVDPEFEQALAEAECSDSNGSVKVALIGIDRSIAAWTRLRAHLPDRADELLDVLVRLDRLRRATEAQFPDARAFKRPGFDE